MKLRISLGSDGDILWPADDEGDEAFRTPVDCERLPITEQTQALIRRLSECLVSVAESNGAGEEAIGPLYDAMIGPLSSELALAGIKLHEWPNAADVCEPDSCECGVTCPLPAHQVNSRGDAR